MGITFPIADGVSEPQISMQDLRGQFETFECEHSIPQRKNPRKFKHNG